MNFHNNNSRLRGPTTVPKKSNSFTFKNNTTNPRMIHRFETPKLSVKNTELPIGLKTPIITKSTLFGNKKNMGYGLMTDELEMDMWNQFFEKEETAYERKENYDKRKNQFSYPPLPEEETRFTNGYFGPYKRNQPQTNANEIVKPTPLRQTVLSPDSNSGLGFKIEKRPKTSPTILQENVAKSFPKWNPSDVNFKPKFNPENKDANFPRMFSVTVDKLLSYPKVVDCGKVIFELFGILERVFSDPASNSLKIIIRSQKMKASLACTFYQIDRQLPKLISGQWHRCVILSRYNGVYQCLSIRSSTVNELKYLEQLVTVSSKSMAILLKSHCEI